MKKSGHAYRLVAAGTLCVLLSGGALSAFAFSAMDEGMRHFSAGRYTFAVGHFERMAIKSPTDPMSRYYLATCYVYLNRHDEAIVEYENCYRLDPFGPVSGYCRQALLAYGRGIPTDAERAALTKPPSALSRVPVSPAAVKNTVNQAVSTIRRQTHSEKSRHRSDEEVSIIHARRVCESVIRRIRDDADRKIREIVETPLNPNGQFGLFSYELERQRREALIASIRQKADADIRKMQDDTEDKIRNHKVHSQTQQGALDEVADSLESQIATSNLKDRVRLRAEGTGLYVRYYGKTDGPIPPARGAVVRFTRHPSAQMQNDSEPRSVSTQDEGDAPVPSRGLLPSDETSRPGEPEKSVSGTLLK